MKRYGYLWAQVVAFDNLLLAYHKARKDKRSRHDDAVFGLNLEKELFQLQDELLTKRYQPGSYRIFTIYERKPRQISAAPFEGMPMSEATIAHLKNHLSELVYAVEQGEDIQITRYGKPVAVMVSFEKYNRALASEKGIFNSYLTWRKQHPDAEGFTDDELEAMRDKAPHDSEGFRLSGWLKNESD